MKKAALTLLVCAVTAVNASNSDADAISSSDLWDVSQGTVVTDHSPVLDVSSTWYSDIRDMFGGEFSAVERNRTLFADRPAGTVHWVEWQTDAPVAVNAYNLVASAEGTNSDVRAVSRFSLYAWDGTSWDLLDEFLPSIPYGGGPTYTGANFLEAFRTFDTVTAQQFRAEFVQSTNTQGLNWGPRINELDGIFVIPEPSVSLLMGGLIAAFATRRKRRLR